MEEDQFRVSKDLLKTIAVDTRVGILKALENRPMTASELSRFLDKHVTTVSEHLDLLKNSNLIERIERPGRKWIYYKLTREGKKVLHPESYRWVMVLSLVFFIVIGSWFVWTVDAYPGQLFYGIKRGRESLQLALAPNSLERAKKHLEFAEQRLMEAKVVIEKGEAEDVRRLIDEYVGEVNQAKLEINKAYKERKSVVSVLETFTEVTPRYVLILENLAVKIPELKKEVQPALNTSIEIHETAAKELQKITGRPYASIARPLQ